MSVPGKTEIYLGMSNFDHSIDEGLEEALKADSKVYAQYPGWNFCGYVYYENDEFNCDVWRYQVKRETIMADSLKEIMEKVSDKYGWD